MSEIFSSQEYQSCRKLVVNASRNSTGREKKANKFNIEKGQGKKCAGIICIMCYHMITRRREWKNIEIAETSMA